MPLKDAAERKAYNAAYSATHREERKAYNAAYSATHREERKACNAAYRNTTGGMIAIERQIIRQRGNR